MKIEQINSGESKDPIQSACEQISNHLMGNPESAAEIGPGLQKELNKQIANGTEEKRKFFKEKLAGVSSMLDELRKSISPDTNA